MRDKSKAKIVIIQFKLAITKISFCKSSKSSRTFEPRN